MQKVAVIGICGAGKSTLSNVLGKSTGLPVVYLDQIFWKSGWVESEREDFRKRVAEIADSERWIIDGNFSSTFDIRFPRADTIIYLDFPRHIALFRAIKRILSYYGKSRPDVTPGCHERFNLDFFRFILSFHDLHRPRIETALAKLRSDQKLIRLKTPAEVTSFLNSLLLREND